ncbi:lactosylceramide 1,3-N-acetyl-beta-D-glucosaminyltransferase-like isoform X2 [Haliotis rubra]|uniref:lactosylceramide 1,3-N-acetyl-beta-D-glucosaminyltransferase-like isoform X2 n=1 Tax=Haliotis rubra TaxID=36100 RepID=UPI001EE50F20|nr:lactosylceramide 1,3-N-acetyl-beta-D-glucosaminyltransferase-like isoform X2 [Haliotis rubra]XP_046561810.1 lactosylceramide 1,3-N-acetyl-beta-D-glucosaminyltransferase-like isoform X2 [Haliotis rubra]XP_046561811.1 lactosylceramide 1,3-N-acetyl-beta-D-glucosaminyltransferase-like isoform X2 [Haliotis rubra]
MRRIRLKLTWCAWMSFITFLALWVMVTEFRLLFSGRDDSRRIVNFFSMDRDRFVNLHEYQFILNTGVIDVDVVTVVDSMPSHVSRRSEIRKTFGSVRYFKGVSSATVFVLGLATNHDLQRQLQQEADTYGDMIQGNFIDDDQNMTHKHVMAMYWVQGHCKRAKVIVKINDDVIVNPYNLVNYIKTTTLPNNTILCKVRTKGIPERRKGKSGYIPIEHYPFPVLPDHCPGFAYITTPHAYRTLCRASRDSRYLHNDAVYATGVLALQAHVRRHHMGDKYIVSGCGEEENIQSMLKDAIFVSSEKGQCRDIHELWPRMKRTNH